jgi:O-antigen ligase
MDVWRTLPGRAEIAEGLRLAGAEPRFASFTLTPERTATALLALLIPAGVFLGAAACTHEQRRSLAALVVVAAGLSLLLGLLQVAGGESSPLRFYPTTNKYASVGLFANRNHQAGLLLLALPLIAVWIDDLLRRRARRLLTVALACAGLFGVVIIGVAVSYSRAGLLLTAPAVLGSLLLLWRGSTGSSRPSAAAAGVGFVCLASLLSVGLFALDRVLRRFGPDVAEDYRRNIWPYALDAADHYAPWGAGLGSFEQVYRSFEPVSLMGPSFVNHAHNEYLQVWLEAGWLGVGLVAALLIWIVWRSALAWAQPQGGRGSRLARAASIGVGLLALHSIVDYPLRTPTIMVVFALLCAGLAQKPDQVRPRG